MSKGQALRFDRQRDLFNAAPLPEPATPLQLDVKDELAYRNLLRDAMTALPTQREPHPYFPHQDARLLGPQRKRIVGTVESAKMNKTIVVRRDSLKAHSKYKKRVRSEKKFYVHDEYNVAKEGDWVRIVETRPMSKTKRFLLEAIIERTVQTPPIRPHTPAWTNSPPLVFLSLPAIKAGSRLVLTAGLTYELKMELEFDQIHLFEAEESKAEDFAVEATDPHGSSAARSDQRGVELDVRISCDSLNIEPKTAVVRSVKGMPKVEPWSFKLTTKEVGIAKLLLWIVAKRTGEVIQTQEFVIPVVAGEKEQVNATRA
jgi:small subunit ribosomal protein S17